MVGSLENRRFDRRRKGRSPADPQAVRQRRTADEAWRRRILRVRMTAGMPWKKNAAEFRKLIENRLVADDADQLLKGIAVLVRR
jgi:hypothetical protein